MHVYHVQSIHPSSRSFRKVMVSSEAFEILDPNYVTYFGSEKMGQWSSPGNYQKEKELAVSSSTINLYVKSEASETISSKVHEARCSNLEF